MDDLAHELLAGMVGRVGLPREDDLHRALRIVQETREPVRIAEDQVRPLVDGEAPRESNRQRVRVERLLGGLHEDVGHPAALELFLESTA